MSSEIGKITTEDGVITAVEIINKADPITDDYEDTQRVNAMLDEAFCTTIRDVFLEEIATRKLVTVKPVDTVVKHHNADTLDLITIGGWQCVSKLGNFQPGDKCVYIEIDSFIPVDREPFTDLAAKAITYEGKVGARIKTIKLRGELSQGYALPFHLFTETEQEVFRNWNEDSDVNLADLLGITKWEKKLPSSLSGGKAKGNFPSFIPKTDEERIQNIFGKFQTTEDANKPVYFTRPDTGEVIEVNVARKNKYLTDVEYEVTVKLDGSSMTVYHKDGEVGVCSRNLELVRSEEGNSFWKKAIELELEARLKQLSWNIAIQGELIGEGIQGNNEKIKGTDFHVFKIWHIDDRRYLNRQERYECLCTLNGMQRPDQELHSRGYAWIKHVPEVTIRKFDFADCKEVLDFAEGPSLNPNTKREGIVFVRMDDPSVSFKAISNSYLLKNGDR